MRIAFAGTPAPAAKILGDLAQGPHDVVMVITQPDRPRGRRGTPTPTPVADAAEKIGITCHKPASINDTGILSLLEREGIGALCVVAFGQILRDPLLDGWPCINVHFSILPAYRGAAPVERALMDGVEETGVTIMQMDRGLDTGPIAQVVTTPVDDDDDAGHVMDRLCELAPPALNETFDRIAAGTFSTIPQPDEGVSIAAKITAEDRALDFSRSALEIVNRVRALSPHIGAKTTISGESFTIWRARSVDVSVAAGTTAVHEGRLIVGTCDGALEILELQPPGRSRMSVGDFMRGWRGGLEVGT